MAYTKPIGVNSLWAASGDKTVVPTAKVSAGWVAEKPSFQYTNQILYNLGLYDAYSNERGIPEWDDETEYQILKSFVIGSDGTLYKCATTNTNNDPSTDDGTNWEEVLTGQGSVSWNINKNYLIGAVVLYNNNLWIAQSANIGVTPTTLASEWGEFVTETRVAAIESEISVGLVGNYEVIVATGAFTAGSFSYPNSHTQDDYDLIVFIYTNSAATAQIRGNDIITKEFIAENSTSWSVNNLGGTSTVDVSIRIGYLSSTSFSIQSSVGNGALKQVIGYIKDGV